MFQTLYLVNFSHFFIPLKTRARKLPHSFLSIMVYNFKGKWPNGRTHIVRNYLHSSNYLVLSCSVQTYTSKWLLAITTNVWTISVYVYWPLITIWERERRECLCVRVVFVCALAMSLKIQFKTYFVAKLNIIYLFW